MASNAGKKGSRVTAKGTKPPVKSRGPGSGGPGGVGKPGKNDAPPAAPASPNRQMRRSGMVPEVGEPPNPGRMKLILTAGGVVAGVLVLACLILFRLSGTWIGIVGLAAGLAAGIAVTTGKTWAAQRGRMIAIGIAGVGVAATVLGVSGVVDFHWPLAALLGCGAGAGIAELSAQQMTEPPSPPQSAIALLKRNGAQHLPAPSTGSCVWATPDGRIRVIVGASVPEGTDGDKLLTDKSIRRSRQRGEMLVRRLAGLGAEPGITCVVDSPVTTLRDGDDIICSAAGLTKALSR